MQKEVTVVDVFNILRRHVGMISVITVLVIVGTYIYTRFMPRMYRSEAMLMVLGEGGQGNAVNAMLAQIAGFSMGGGAMGGSSNSGKMKILLTSRTLAESVVKRHDLVKEIFADSWNAKESKWDIEDPKNFPTHIEAGRVLQGMIKVDIVGDSTMFVGIESTDKLHIAKYNQYVLEELDYFLKKYEVTDAKKNRIFVEKQLRAKERALLEAGVELSQFYSQNKVSASQSKVDVTIGKYIDMDFDLEESKGSDPNKSSHDLNETIQTIENSVAAANQKLSQMTKVRDVPQQIYLQYLTIKNESLATLTKLLAQQYEMAKIDEERESIAYRVIDGPRTPLYSFKPNVRLILIVSLFLGAILGVTVAIVIELWSKVKNEAST